MDTKVILEIKTPRTGEETPEAMVQFLASLAHVKVSSGKFFKKIHTPLSFEIALIDQTIRFFICIPQQYQSFVESQLLSQYPKSLITTLKKDPVADFFQEIELLNVGRLNLQTNYVYPLKTFNEFKEIDPLSSLLGLFSKLGKEDAVLIQLVLTPAGNWQAKAQHILDHKPTKEEEDPLQLSTYSKQIQEKITYPGFNVGIRVLAKSTNPGLVEMVAATFNSLNKVNGNSLTLEKPYFWQKKKFIAALIGRSADYIPAQMILNVAEIASFYHFPSMKLSSIQNISWSRQILSDAPENLPVALDKSDAEKKEINFFARTEYKNHQTTFGILREDRRKHVYIIGKTGTGKSTFIANKAINDIRNGEGLAIIDPHGDLSQTILDFIPSYRVNDVVYLNPSDIENPFHLNPLEITDQSQKILVASGIVSIFYKLYAHSWGPRLEYILRNTILTLLEVPNATLMMIPPLLTDQEFRKKIVRDMTDPVLKNFWINEFEKMSPQMMTEATSPILNKVGQFLSSPVIRNIVGSPKSTIDLEKCMNEGKIVIMNLSQGKIGEDNSALLGAMIITKLQIAAMNRVNIEESQRRDFYLYVDEFQNFATTSFIKILSEARKYRLCLILANQYIGQIQEDVRLAIFGNAGTMITFIVGASDAPYLAKEFGERFKEEDILSLANYQVIVKMAIQGLTSTPFMAYTLPLPQSKTQNREKVIKVSRERYTRSMNDIPALKNEQFEQINNKVEMPILTQVENYSIAVSPLSLNSKELLQRTVDKGL